MALRLALLTARTRGMISTLSLAPVATRSFTSAGSVSGDAPIDKDAKDMMEAQSRNIGKYTVLVRSGPDGSPLMENIYDNYIGRTPQKAWSFTEKIDDEHLHLSTEMPGFGKEEVKVVYYNPKSLEGTIMVSVEGKMQRRIRINPKLYKVDSRVKTKMENGVLYLTVPKKNEGDKQGLIKIKVN